MAEDDASLQARIDVLLQPDTEAADVTETSVQAPFSPFIPAHARRAGEVASRLFAEADENGLEAGVAAAEEAARTESSRGLVMPHACGSMSYCGARERYPDERPMGYPFHRPFPDGVVATLAALPNVAMRDLTIRCENARPPE